MVGVSAAADARGPGADRTGPTLDGAGRREATTHPPRAFTQWAGLLLAPAAFFLHLQLGYVLVYRACRYHAEWSLHAVGLASVAVAALGAWTAWRVWGRSGRTTSLEADGASARARFLGMAGVGVSSLLVLVLLAQWAAAFFLSPCQ